MKNSRRTRRAVTVHFTDECPLCGGRDGEGHAIDCGEASPEFPTDECPLCGVSEGHAIGCGDMPEDAMKNLCAKTVTPENAYEVWENARAGWKWIVLKKWQANDEKPYARWFCLVKSPFVPEGEMGDVYVSEIKSNAIRIK